MYRFEDKLPIALLVVHLRHGHFQDILSTFSSSPGESLYIINGQGQVVASLPTATDQEDFPDFEQLLDLS
jgi:hypothetical protein